MTGEGEFAQIKRYFAPLSEGAFGAGELGDDGTLIDLSPDETFAVSTDTSVSGVHFLTHEDPDIIARRALRTALSDLAAMGAEAFGYTLNLTLPDGSDETFLARFCQGLTVDQATFGVRLLGGDTTRGSDNLVVSVTVFGRRPNGVALRRSGARAGDSIVVTGSIGDAGLGLLIAKGELGLDEPDQAFLLDRYRLPQPRLRVGRITRRFASAAIDISDGLLADIGHIASQSQLTAHLDLGNVEVSGAAQNWLTSQNHQTEARLRLATAGDDYELALTTAQPVALMAELGEFGLQASVVGHLESFDGEFLKIFHDGSPVEFNRTGFTHF